jgi:hypothetical protein
VYISMMICNQHDLSLASRQIWGRMFGLFIQKGREKKGYSVEQAARLACMEPSAWVACEDGQVPETAERLRSMARALEFSEVQFANVIRLCRDAWGGNLVLPPPRPVRGAGLNYSKPHTLTLRGRG